MEKKSLLIFHQGAFGDLVLTFPVITALKKYYSNIDGICQTQLGKLACHLDVFNKYTPLESAMVSSLYSDNIDLIIKEIINSYDDVILFSFSCHLENTVNRLRKKPAYRISPRPPIQLQNIHVTDYLISALINHRLIKQKDLEILPSPYRRVINYKPQSKGKILIHPGSGSTRKNWPMQNFINLYNKLEQLGFKPEFITGPAEKILLEHIKKEEYPVKIHSPDNLIDLHSIIKTALIYIGNDSGVSHLAAFSKKTCVIIFGPSDPVRWRPGGRNVHVIRPEGLKCLPCFETQKDNCLHPLCLNNISVNQVLNIVKNLVCNVC